VSEIEDQLRQALSECARLRAENSELRTLLKAHNLLPEPTPESTETAPVAGPEAVTNASPPEQKLELFRRLFRGREDVYAIRWQKGEKSGYSPAAVMDWHAIHAAGPEHRKEAARKTRSLLPLTDEAVRSHLEGRVTIGVYPLLPDETCRFLAVDFDKLTSKEDAAAFLAICRHFGVSAALERSRSGNGAHVWIFFERPVPAVDARRLGAALLTRTTEFRHQVSLDSYDRFFPNQDTMPKGGFGNLIALPLQKAPRKAGNSVFVDDHFQPYPDQWLYLSGIEPIPAEMLPTLIHEIAPEGNVVGVRIAAEEEDDTSPWLMPPSRKSRGKPIVGPFPAQARVVLGNLVYVEKLGLPSPMLNRLIRLGAFQNPEFYRAQAMRLSTYGKPRVISCSENFPEHVGLPRGCLDEVLGVLKDHSIRVELLDKRTMGLPIEAEFHGTLRPAQEEAIAKVKPHDIGVICAPTAFGKTVVGARLIAHRKVSTLVIVHRQQLLDQWRTRLAAFLNLPLSCIGQIGGGKTSQTGKIDVAAIQSLHRKKEVLDLVADYGQVIVDECHHVSAFTFEQVLKQAKATYIVGLTATPVRKDGHHPIIYMQCGPIRFNLTARKAAVSSPFKHSVIPRYTNFTPALEEGETTIQNLYQVMVTDVLRNDMVIRDLVEAIKAGRSPLLLTGRKEHLEHLAGRLSGVDAKVFVLRGGMGRKQRREIAEALAELPRSTPRIILATGSYIGEGFDDARLDMLFLAMPISWKGTLQQYVGRLHRLHDGKKDVQVYDYVDSLVPMLMRMFKKRIAGYDALGYSIEASEPVNAPR
jgi:superfamily II DNA or RNA helicase